MKKNACIWIAWLVMLIGSNVANAAAADDNRQIRIAFTTDLTGEFWPCRQ